VAEGLDVSHIIFVKRNEWYWNRVELPSQRMFGKALGVAPPRDDALPLLKSPKGEDKVGLDALPLDAPHPMVRDESEEKSPNRRFVSRCIYLLVHTQTIACRHQTPAISELFELFHDMFHDMFVH
jgi:hypothetical protein